MKYEAILFDLDGTLLPIDNDEFTKGYLGLLAKAVAPYGYTKETLIPAMWKGVGAMVKNDGSRLNYDAFWQTFEKLIGKQVYEHIPVFDAFYNNEFHQAITFTKPTPLAKEAVLSAKEHADKVVLATNPFFPAVAVHSRLKWAGITPDLFDMITTYDHSSYCKPNPEYYIEITTKLGVDPKKCLMIGNNAEEDIRAAQTIGMDTFLLTDYLICEGEMPETIKGTFKDMITYLNTL